MRNYLPKFLAGGVLALGLSFAALPAQAAATGVSFSNALQTSENANLIKVHHHRDHFRHPHYGGHRHHRHHHRRHYRPAPRSGLVIEFNTRPVYRPAPVYVAPPVYRVAPAPRYAMPHNHVSWCASRYKSYRASDNTFQPYNGPRRTCASPYWR
jgi:hypothetical protein